jgi:micrococcal nuclease
MKHTILIFLITFLFTSYSYAFEGTVILITDGDTITVVHDGKPEKIRLYGIDTPGCGGCGQSVCETEC